MNNITDSENILENTEEYIENYDGLDVAPVTFSTPKAVTNPSGEGDGSGDLFG